MMRLITTAAGLVAALSLCSVAAPAFAQLSNANVVSACGTPNSTYGVNNSRAITQTTTGNLCVNGTFTGTVTSTGTVTIKPSASSADGITSIVSTSAESGHILKASAGNFYGVYVTTGATPGYLLVFDAVAVPSNGAVTPKHCIVAPANSTTGLTFNSGPPGVFATGISAAFSTTGCFTLMLSATAFFNGRVQ